MAQGGQGVGGFARLADGDHQATRVGHRVAVAVFAGHFNLGRDVGHALQPVLGGATAVVTGAAGQDEHRVDVLEHAVRVVAGLGLGAVKQLGHDALNAFQGVGNGTRLFEDFFLHVVAVRPQLGRAAVGVDGVHLALHRLVLGIDDPVLAHLHIHHIALGQIHNLIGHACQGHGVAGQKVFALAHAQNQWGTRARAHHPVRLVFGHHSDGIGTAQLAHCGLHRLEQIALVERIDQMSDDLGVGLAGKGIAFGLQFSAQFFVVFNDAVVHQANAAFALARLHAGARAEMRMGVVHRRCAMGGPAGVGNAGRALQATGRRVDLGHQLGHPLGAARALQTWRLAHLRLRRVDRDAAGVVTPVLQALQALDQDGNNIAARNRADDAAHGVSPVGEGTLSPPCRNNRFI